MKTMLSAAAAFGLLFAASASNPAAAAGTYQSSAVKAAAAVAVTPGAKDLGGIISVDDDAEYYVRYEGNQSNNRYNQWPYPQPGNYGAPRNYQGDSDPSWRDRNWNNNPWWNPYQGSHYGNRKPLPDKLIVHRLRQQHFYNVTKIKEKKGYYKVYAFDAYRRPVSVIVDPYTGRVLRVGPR